MISLIYNHKENTMKNMKHVKLTNVEGTVETHFSFNISKKFPKSDYWIFTIMEEEYSPDKSWFPFVDTIILHNTSMGLYNKRDNHLIMTLIADGDEKIFRKWNK